VDLICERAAGTLSDADAFVPHFGGSLASVALMAARAGARVALAGGAGADEWGHWLRFTLERAGVDLRHFKLLEDRVTPLCVTTVTVAGEPVARHYEDLGGTVIAALADGVEAALAESGGLLIGSDTLIDLDERAVTMRAREVALELGQPVIVHPALRLARWRSKLDAVASVNACVPGALLVYTTAPQARLLTGEEDLERAALALRKAGARNVVIGEPARGAILRGRINLEVPAPPVNAVSDLGAGDALMAVLVARLQITGYYEPAIAAAMKDAMAAAAHARERWGACD